MKWNLLLSIVAAGTLAHAAENTPNAEPVDLSTLSQSHLSILEGFSPARGPGGPGGHKMPKFCEDAAITPDQHDQIQEAVFASERERIKIEADLKVAMMDYVHTIGNENSAEADATTNGGLISEGVAKMAANKIGLTNNIVYKILKPEQRENAVKCMMMMEKMMMRKKLGEICKNIPKGPGPGDGHHGGDGHHPHPRPNPNPTPAPTPEPAPTPAPQPTPEPTPAP